MPARFVCDVPDLSSLEVLRIYGASWEQSFVSQFRKVLVIQFIRHGDHPIIESSITAFVAADQQDCCTPGIKAEERPERATAGPGPQLLHVSMLSCLRTAGPGRAQAAQEDERIDRSHPVAVVRAFRTSGQTRRCTRRSTSAI
jgi:hypothetical protein